MKWNIYLRNGLRLQIEATCLSHAIEIADYRQYDYTFIELVQEMNDETAITNL